jgi:hypothetical protein
MYASGDIWALFSFDFAVLDPTVRCHRSQQRAVREAVSVHTYFVYFSLSLLVACISDAERSK